MLEKMNRIKSIISSIKLSLNISWNSSKQIFIFRSILVLIESVLPIIIYYIWSQILNSVVDSIVFNKVILLLLIYCSLLLIINLLKHLNNHLGERYNDLVVFYLEKLMIEKMSRMDLKYYDSSSMGDKVKFIRNNFGTIINTSWLMFDVLTKTVSIMLSIFIIFKYNYLLALITILSSIPLIIYQKIYFNKKSKLEKKLINNNRKKEYFADVFTDVSMQLEMKLYSTEDYFFKKYINYWKMIYKENSNFETKNLFYSILFFICSIISEIIALIFSVFDFINGGIGIGTLQYNINIVMSFKSDILQINTLITSMGEAGLKINDILEFLNIEPLIEGTGKLILNEDLFDIEFKNVYFKYPNSKKFVLKNCSFAIKKKTRVAFVGLNGSGKSTIIKLLFRFYDVSEGEVKINGINIKEYDIYRLRQKFAILFQNYVTYNLPLREIIALSQYRDVNNNQRLKYACDLAGVSEIISEWPKKYDTVIGRYYSDEGKSFSGGQWQKVSLARTYFKDAEFVILDEPSASLDAISEEKIFNQLYNLSNNKSSIIISHTLSNVKLANYIMVIEEGKVIEEGSHKDLIRRKGRYALLYNLQKEKYV